MKSSYLLGILKQKHLTIPLYLYKLREKLQLSCEEFFFLMYLYNQGEDFLFNPLTMTEDLDYDLSMVMDFISKLADKHLLQVEVRKNDKNVMEEYVSLESFYEKLSNLLREEMNQSLTIDVQNVYEKIEQEFARPLSPMEYEIVKAWIDNHMSEELILLALKEAVYSGVSNLRYIDKILYEWGKKGYKNASDVEKGKKKHREQNNTKPEVFEYDWLEDEEYGDKS